MLDVKQKRRIYDITNVLEGIGLIEKETKNTIKWKWVDRHGYSGLPRQVERMMGGCGLGGAYGHIKALSSTLFPHQSYMYLYM